MAVIEEAALSTVLSPESVDNKGVKVPMQGRFPFNKPLALTSPYISGEISGKGYRPVVSERRF